MEQLLHYFVRKLKSNVYFCPFNYVLNLIEDALMRRPPMLETQRFDPSLVVDATAGWLYSYNYRSLIDL
jgi:hypothetical protein